MAANVVFSAIEHALAYVAVQIWVVVVYYPLSLGYRLRICEGMVVGGNQLTRFRDVTNLDTVMEAIAKAKPAAAKGTYLKSATIATTMGPGIRLNTLKYGV